MNVLALSMPGSIEWVVIALVALLIFGKRLPSVARSIGQCIVEFRSGLRRTKEGVNEVKEELLGEVSAPFRDPELVGLKEDLADLQALRTRRER